MANSPLSNLAAALTRDAGAPIVLTRDYLIAGLADASVSVGASLDADLKAAFQSPVAGLTVTLTAQSVQPLNPTTQTFKVTGVSARFLQQDVKQGLVLTFGLKGDAGAQSLTLEIVTTPASWTWSDLSSFATGIPFKWAAIANAVFTFKASQGPLQAFAANLTPPAQLATAVAVVQNLGFPTLALPFTGSMDFAKVDGVEIFMPTTTLQAPFLNVGDGLKLLYLNVQAPVFGLVIGPPEQQDAEDQDEAYYDQRVSLFFGLDLSLTDQQGRSVDYQLRALAQINNGSAFNFYLGHSDNGSALLTPATIIGLLDNNGSFFSGTPPVLQQFLSGIGLRSLSLSGATSPRLVLSTASVTLGADPTVINAEHPWVPLQDPTNHVIFGVTDFELVWGINFLPQGNAQSYLFQTTFLLLPEVFKGKTADENGLFFVQFNSDLQLLARFDGTANLNDLIATLTMQLIRIPKSFVDASLSDVGLSLDVGAKSYAFNAGFELDLNLFTLGGQPILSVTDGQLYLKATTPTASGAANTTPTTTYQAGISGLVGIGPYFATASLDYDGSQTPATWKVAAQLAQPVDVEQLVSQFLSFGGAFDFPDFLPGTLLVNTLEVDASLNTGDAPLDSYTVAGSLRWTFNLGQAFSVDTLATLSLSYDASKPANQQYSGSATTLWDFSFLNDSVLLGYSFAPDNQGSNAQLSLSWEGLTAIYQVDKQTLTFTLKNWSLGRLIQKLMQSLGDPYFTLTSPWDVLNQISLDGLSLIINLETSDGKTPSIAAKYTLASKIDLGFMSIDGLVFERKKVDGVDKITLGIDGSSVFKGNNPQEQQDWSNLLDPQKGQPVDKLPSVPGQGTDYFSLPLMVLGQRVAISGYDSFANTKAVIDALKKVPATTGSSNPMNPADSGTKGIPYYNRNSDWLIAGQLLLLKTGKDWTVDLMLVFNDPNLYGLRLALAGEKAKALGNLVLDILYKKITDDVGVYQIEWTFPDSIRNLNFGAVSIVLPEIGVKIYTNGDFFIDIGFPYNLDFTRSFSISAIVYGVPVLGAGGFYLGKLSSVTATQVPKTTQGTFDPVIVFGLGLQLGLGYNFVKGPLKAGFALTVFGILEGTIAAFHAYRPSTALVPAGKSVQDDYYFKIQGTVGVIGLLYGSIDFAIISASVNVRITLSLSLTYESYKPIPIAARATVEVSVKVKIDLGLFSFSISFSFHADVSARFEINALNSGPAPWAEPTRLLARQARHVQLASNRRAASPQPMTLLRGAVKPALTLYATPQFSVMCNEGANHYADQQGAFVFLLTMDAPSPTQQAQAGGSSFERLCADYLPWLIGTLGSASSAQDTLADILGTQVDKALLEVDIERLADLANPPFGIGELLTFLSSFDVSITLPDASNQARIKEVLEAGSVLFPVFDGLSLSVPLADAGTATVDFAQYAGTNSTYRSNVAQMFKELAALVTAKDDAPAPPLRTAADDRESMAAVIFTDAFMVIGRQLLQVALNAFDDYAYATANGNSIEQILNWSNVARGNSLTLDDIVRPNAESALSAGLSLNIPLPAYTLQSADTLARVAGLWSDSATPARWQTTAAGLILANGYSTVIAAGQVISLPVGQDIHQCTTGPGETFNSLADTLGVDLATLARDSALYDMAGLLLPGQPLLLPNLAYQTAAGDSLTSSGARFGVSAMALFSDPQSANLRLAPLFASDTITLTALDSLFTEDLWNVVVATDQLAQLAGMLSRFLAYGLRLPSNPAGMGGLSLSPDFLYPNAQSAYGLYQLTGQQFPTPVGLAPGSDYPIGLSRAASSHGVDLSFVQIAGASSGSMNLNQAYSNLSGVLAYAQQGKFQPAPRIDLLPTVARSPKDYAVKSVSLWSTADLQQLRALCQPALRANAQDGASVQPLLWSLPDGLIRLSNQRVASLASQLPKLAQQLPYLPAFSPYEVSTDPATLETSSREIASYSYATRVDFSIKRLPQAEPGAIAGSGSSLSYTYQLLGPSATDAQLLERLLVAISELGTHIISGQFLLMPQGNAKASNLLSQAQSDFLAFLTQTNLSTETNPPPSLMNARLAEDAGPRGILNPAEEVVKLLWELSTVRSGGYYLSYYDRIAASGLPDSIFDDSGSATLTLVVTYPRGGADPLQGRLCNFVNAFVSTDTVVQQGSHMALRSASTTDTSQPTGAGDSLDSLAAFYGIGVGRIAELNPQTLLSNAAQVPLDGIVHLVTPAESAAGNGQGATILENLARYYSVGAVQPISATQIANLNPNVSVASGVALFIPALSYAVDPALAPGNRLQSLADYYSLDLDAVAVGAARVAGLFASASRLNIDTRTFDLQAVFNQGNAAFSVLRDNPPPVDSPSTDPDGYASAYLYNLYSVLSAGLDGSPWFSASDLALPFGPQRPDSGADPEAAQAHRLAMRDPQSRRDALDALAQDSQYSYQQTLGLARRATTNAAPLPDKPGLPAAADNPYRGVGSFAQVNLTWLDIFGNITVTPFTQPPAGYTGSLNHPPLPLRYSDRLIALSAWPNTRSFYTYAAADGGAQLVISLSLDTSSYDPASGTDIKVQAAKDLEMFSLIYYQLNQSYKDLKLPWCQGRAVSVELVNSLFAQPLSRLDDSQAQPLLDYVNGVILYLGQVVQGVAAKPPATVELKLSVDIDGLAAGSILPLSLTLSLRRVAALVEPDVAGLEGGVAVTSTLLPVPDPLAASTSGYSQFAAAFEALFQRPGAWMTRVGSGTADPGSTPDG
ncbi:LysM peptidoglycan-binding domain-containing protein, partial [Pseudomonas chlororaphis]